MSMQFSDTSGRTGIVELLEDLTTTQSATTSSYPLKTKTRDINNAFAKYMQLAIASAGRWQVDDTNQTDYPIIKTNLVANQQDYSFTVDANSNQILDIHRVEILDTAGNAVLLKPIDQEDIKNMAMTEYQKTAGTPTFYDKTSNGIVLYPAPSYNSTNGLKIYTSRTPSYFVSTDTTKKPGIPDMFHEYLALRPAYYYCLQKSLPQTNNYYQEMLDLESRIKEYHRDRSKDDKVKISTAYYSAE